MLEFYRIRPPARIQLLSKASVTLVARLNIDNLMVAPALTSRPATDDNAFAHHGGVKSRRANLHAPVRLESIISWRLGLTDYWRGLDWLGLNIVGNVL